MNDKRPAHSDSTEIDTGSIHSTYITYVDESGDHSLHVIDTQYPLFVLAFCVFHKAQYTEQLVPALEKFKFDYFGHDQIILHESEIRKEKGAFNIFRSREQKKQFLEDLTSIIDRSNFIVISCVIDKSAMRKQTDVPSNPYHVALEFCLERLYQFLRENGHHTKKNYIVVECRGKKEDKELGLEFRRICGGDNRLAIRLPFEILFSDKKTMSAGLQMADLVARPIGLNALRHEQENKAFNVLKCKFYCDGTHSKKNEESEETGLRIYPPLKSEKPR